MNFTGSHSEAELKAMATQCAAAFLPINIKNQTSKIQNQKPHAPYGTWDF
jgi:hypothetical protein